MLAQAANALMCACVLLLTHIAACNMQARQLMVDLGVSPDNIFSADLSPNNPASLSALKVALQGCEALVICTSAVPQPHVLATLWGAAGHFITQKLRRNSTDDPFVPVATWKGGQTPQQVIVWLCSLLVVVPCHAAAAVVLPESAVLGATCCTSWGHAGNSSSLIECLDGISCVLRLVSGTCIACCCAAAG
jgi:hypothetical protein